jgi:hypothetical protein
MEQEEVEEEEGLPLPQEEEEGLPMPQEGVNCYFAHDYDGLRRNALYKVDFVVMYFISLTHR